VSKKCTPITAASFNHCPEWDDIEKNDEVWGKSGSNLYGLLPKSNFQSVIF